MKSTKKRPTSPGWYWYRDEVVGVIAAEVFRGSDYYGGELIAFAPGYNFLPSVRELKGDWSIDAIPSAPPWLNEFESGGKDARAPKNPHAAALGKKGRAKNTPAQADTSRANGAKPPRPGSKPRGRPRKSPDNPPTP